MAAAQRRDSMSGATTLFRLAGDRGEMFDGSVNGIAILKATNAKLLPADSGVAIDNGFVDVARHRDLDGLQSFTLEAVVRPTRVGGARQNIAEAQTPSVALFIEANGKLVGSVHSAAGWVTVDSGATLVKAGTPVGVLAFDGDEPVGWCSIAPRETYARLSRSHRTPALKSAQACRACLPARWCSA